ncbi:MAG: hypothetical protein MO853_05045 [Candidatus Protistobacter heckmanni]|nr:hypothetical protein [Candidatus Protistobacter heckmanni]
MCTPSTVEPRLLLVSARPLGDMEHGISGGFVVFSDITEQHLAERHNEATRAELLKTQERLLDAQRLARLGNWEQDLRTNEI